MYLSKVNVCYRKRCRASSPPLAEGDDFFELFRLKEGDIKFSGLRGRKEISALQKLRGEGNLGNSFQAILPKSKKFF